MRLVSVLTHRLDARCVGKRLLRRHLLTNEVLQTFQRNGLSARFARRSFTQIKASGSSLKNRTSCEEEVPSCSAHSFTSKSSVLRQSNASASKLGKSS